MKDIAFLQNRLESYNCIDAEEEMNAILAIYSDMTIDSFFKTIVNNEVKYYGYQRRVSAGGKQQLQSYFKNIKIEIAKDHL